MAKRTLTERVEILEQRVEKLESLPGEVAALRAEFLQFREENRMEHLAIRQEIKDGFEEGRRHALVLYENLIERIKTIREG